MTPARRKGETMGKIETVEGLRKLYRAPSERAQRKQLDALDAHCRRFIASSPFVVLASSASSGADATPRGGEPGFVKVQDAYTLLLPDWPGNNRLDSLTNIVENPTVGLLFLIPGVDETLRVGGTAQIRTDEALLEPFHTRNKLPLTVLVIHVERAYLHCAKALMRSKLWCEDARLERGALPTANEILRDQSGGGAEEALESQEAMEQRYKGSLY